jgi:hypothetical protein
MTKFGLTLFFAILFQLCLSQNVVINEIVTLNNNIIEDDFGEHSDWVELFNKSDIGINLGSWYLSDDESNTLKWIFPDTTIEAHGFILIFCSGRDTLTDFLHSNFKLKVSGDPLFLSDQNGNLVDAYFSISLESNVSYGRIIDGGEEFEYFYRTSPGITNSNNLIRNTVSFSLDEGFHEPNSKLLISTYDNAGQVYFTVNGNEPVPGTPFTFIYNDTLSLSHFQSMPAVYSYIPTSPGDLPQIYPWIEPEGEVEKCIVLKARVFELEQPLCNTLSATYFIHENIENRFSTSVLSISLDSIDLFSYDTGIYVPGKRYVPGIVKSGNYFEKGQAWERKGWFTLFSSDGELLHKQALGIEIQGNMSRAFPHKSLEYTSKECYDGQESLNYPFFSALPFSNYKKVITRSIFAAHDFSIVRDEIMQEIAKNLDVVYQEWQPVTTFINGEYWGFQVMREKLDEHYLHQHYDIDVDSVDIIDVWGIPGPGDLTESNNLNYFVENHDLSLPENYAMIKEMINIPAYIDYYITEIFIANRDWPGNNYTKWREKKADSKWHWFLYDLDDGGTNLYLNNIKRATGDTIDEIMPYWSTFMFKALLSNEEFKTNFINRFVDVLNTDFHSDNTIPILDKWESIVEKEVDNLILRWHIVDSKEHWLEQMDIMRQFFQLRPCIIKNQLEEYFGIDSLNINCGTSQDTNIPAEMIQVYPNPSKSFINIKAPFIIEKWELYSLTGILVGEKENGDAFDEVIDISKINPEVYFLKITQQGVQYHQKIIKTD